MPKLIYCRIAGNAVSFSMHSINSILMLSALQDEIVFKDPEIKILASMQSTFFTIWNILFQLIYAGLALTCDVLTIMNKDHLLPKPIKKFRDVFFSSVVWPGTFFVFTFFWSIFLYDRSLIFPSFIDKVFSNKNNYVMHLAIVPVVLWEFMFQPRNIPKSHRTNITIVSIYYIVYNVHIHLTYNERGLWPYPLIGMVYETIYYFYFQFFISLWTLACYYVQWPLYTLIWGKDKNISEKSK